MTEQDEERGKQTLINKESEVTGDKKSKGLKSKKSYQTDYEGAGIDEEMKDEGGDVVRD